MPSPPVPPLPCRECGGPKPKGSGRRLCAPCAEKCAKETRLRANARGAKPLPTYVCPVCQGPKEPGRGRKYCIACAAKKKAEVASRERDWTYVKARRLAAAPPERQHRRARVAATPPGYKYCPRCDEHLPVDEFGRRRSKNPYSNGAYKAYCRPCERDSSDHYRLRRVFGIGLEEYAAMFEAQDGRCGICGNRPRTRKLAVDHDHKTGAVRGLLCTQCNHKLLGGARDSVDMLQSAIDYLTTPPAEAVLKQPC